LDQVLELQEFLFGPTRDEGLSRSQTVKARWNLSGKVQIFCLVVASKIPILLIRLGLKRLDSWLAIMGFEDADSPRPIPLLADLRGRMDEPTAAIRD
jgi:hypothetical protein